MVKRSKLLQALDDHKGRDYAAEKQKKLVKAAEKKKAAKQEKAGVEKTEEGDKTEEKKEVEQKPDSKAAKSKKRESTEAVTKEDNKSDSDDEEVDEDYQDEGDDDDEEEEEEEEEDEEEDIPLSDLSDDEREDVVPHQRLTINNSAAINNSIKRISFITSQTPFSEHQSLVSKDEIDIPDPNDDLNRELAFYKVCQSAASTARGLLKKEGVPFTRPGDYFAEMVKDDEHMGRIKKKLFDEAAAKKASAEARKQRDLKKFGKQVQVAKLQQRNKEKRETLDKINELKKKRKADTSAPTDDAGDMFDVAIDEANKPESRKRGRDGEPKSKRQKKDQKFGFGGKKRFAKSGDAVSSGDMSGFSSKKMKAGAKGGAKRPGKSKRAASKGKF